MSTHPRKIALLLGQDLGYCRGVIAGILDYAEHHRLDWTFRDGPPTPEFLDSLRKWNLDGIIAHIFDRDLALSLQSFGVPVINVTLTLGELPFPVVDVDHLKVGQQAADYFLKKGHHTFAYFGSETAMFSRAREQGFKDQLAKNHHSVSSMHVGFLPHTPWNIDWEQLDLEISQWLNELPKPVAILASNDIPGRHLASICRKLGFRIPDEIAILGVDNDDSECRMSHPSLSSIALPTRKIGSSAGEILQQSFLKNEIPKSNTISISPVGVIERQSTDSFASPNTTLEKILTWIQDHLEENPSVDAIANRHHISRRSLERLFEQKLGMSILQFKTHCRLETAKSLLRETEYPLHHIAEKSGFSSVRALTENFRKKDHLTPTAYRKLSRT